MTKEQKKFYRDLGKQGLYCLGAFLSGVLLVAQLNHNPSYAKFTKKEYDSLVDLSEEEEKKFLAYYPNYIDIVAREIVEVGMNTDALSAFGSYVAMQNSGAISYNDFSTAEPTFEIRENEGFSVVLGSGVCRHQCNNLYLVLKRLGYECGIVSGVIGKEENIDQKREQVGTSELVITHTVVYVKEKDGTIFLLDPLYKTIFIQEYQNEWISVTNKELKFEIWENINTHNINDVYKYRGKELAHRITWGTRCERALLKGEEYLEYYQEYEKTYLLDIETQIESQVNEYYEEQEREKILRNAGYKFDEKGE